MIVKLRADSPVLREQVFSIRDERQRRARALGRRLGVELSSGRAIADRVQVVTANGIASRDLARRLAREFDVEYAVVDERKYRLTAPNDPLYAAGVPGNGPAVGQWYLRAPSGEVQSSIDVETAWNYTTGTFGTIVAVVDTGVRFEHPDLLAVAAGGKLLPGYDMISVAGVANDGDTRDPDASDPGDWITAAEANDRNGLFYQCTPLDPRTNQYLQENSSWHGTQVSGIIGAITNNGIGMAGVGPNLRILPVRVLGKCGGYDSDIIAGIRWAAGLQVPGVSAGANAARVINLSFGGPGDCTQAFQDAIDEVTAAGAVLVAAAGNTEGHAAGIPANCTGVIGVGGLRHAGTKVGFSDLGLNVAISAPAGNCVNVDPGSACLYPILTTSNSGSEMPVGPIYTDSYNASLGTSFAAPLVTGTVALMLSAQPSLTPYQARLLLQKTARPFPTTGGDNGDGTPVPQCFVPHLDAQGNPIDQDQCYCTVNTCGAGMLDAGAAVRAAATGVPAPIVQAGGLWSDIADAEDGTGFTISHQGDVIFLAWYTYDGNGRALWLSMTANKVSSNPETYTGQILTAVGPPFNAVPFDPKKVLLTTVGSGTLTFIDLNNAKFSYIVNNIFGTKTISRTLFGMLPNCTYGPAPDFVHATNYQDVWWVPNGAEGGWGLMLSQQGNIIFAAWFTYDTDGKPMWLSVTAFNTASGVYSGNLIRTTGPPFGTYDASLITRTTVGAATLTFANGLAGTFNYTLNGVQQTKQIARYLFAPPAGTLCQ
ncbi:MAG TPA: S8 family peptidase [Casimicrobiaceae bacterium]|nr:S8 family peptidase [Casimicrobiaceae bacterium]